MSDWFASGYEGRRSAVIQLRQLLNISNKQFIELKETIKSITISTLDVELQGQSQVKALTHVVQMVQNKYPEILDNHQKLAFARKVAMQFHRHKRRNKCRARGGRVSPVKSTSDEVTTSSQGVAGRRISGPSKKVLGPPLTVTFQDPQVESDQGINTFLQGCWPPMGHLSERLVDLGFYSPEILQIVADEWSPDERRNLLKRLLPSSNGKGISELEIQTLQKAFVALRSKV